MGTPTGLTRFIYPEFPPKLRSYGWNGKGRFLLKVNPKTGDVDEVIVLKRTGQVVFDEFSAGGFVLGFHGDHRIVIVAAALVVGPAPLETRTS